MIPYLLFLGSPAAAFSPFANSDAMAFAPPELDHNDAVDWVLLIEVHPAFRAKRAGFDLLGQVARAVLRLLQTNGFTRG
jgi:hypothetical protein